MTLRRLRCLPPCLRPQAPLCSTSWLRLLGDFQGTQGNAEAVVVGPVRRAVPETNRRPAIRGLAAPTAAPVHAERVRRGTKNKDMHCVWVGEELRAFPVRALVYSL